MPAATVNTLIPGGAVVPPLVTKLTRGKPVNLGTLVAANTAVAFTVPEPTRDNQGFVVLQVTGTAGTTATLEVSIDGGATFVTLTLTPLGVTTLTGDTAATAGYQVQIAGYGAGALFKFGYGGAGVPTAAVWALVG